MSARRRRDAGKKPAPGSRADGELSEREVRVADLRCTVYAGPLAEFIERRKAAVGELRDAGYGAEAKEASRWAKPSVSAWAVNALFNEHREEVDRLIERGAALREAQSRARAASNAAEVASSVRRAAEQRRASVDRLVEIAEDLLVRDGHGAARATLNRIRRTLEAISSRELDESELTPEERPGTLESDLEPPAFEGLLAGLAAGLEAARGSSASGSATATQEVEASGDDGGAAEPSRRGRESPAKSARQIAARLEAQRVREHAASTEERLESARQEASAELRERQRREKALDRRQRALDEQRQRLSKLQAERDEAAKEHDRAVRAHRRRELEILELERRLERLRRDLERLEPRQT